MSAEEQALLAELRSKKQAAESVFKALQRAEDAATAAATASGDCLPNVNSGAAEFSWAPQQNRSGAADPVTLARN